MARASGSYSLDVTRLRAVSSKPDRVVTASPPAVVCHCRRVPYEAVRRAIESGRATSLADIQRETTACTRCFGCRFELQRILEERLGDRYRPTEFVARVPGESSLLRRLAARVRGRSVLPRRMYMPALAGFRGRDVDTRVVLFNWAGGSADGTPVTVRADLLALDGTRRAVWEHSVPPGGSAAVGAGELLPDELEGGVGAFKLVLDAPELGSLRPYFHLVSPGGITSTHEKAGPADPSAIERRRPYHWVFPVGFSERQEEAYLFCTNTQARPMEGHELIWQDESEREERTRFPPLELDQSACIALHEHFPDLASGRFAGTVRLVPATHKVAGFILRYDDEGDRWRVQHL